MGGVSRILAGIMVTSLSMASLPALAKATAKNTTVQAEVAMPFTPAFGTSITRYRNCVLRAVDAQALTDAATMASDAMNACALYRGEVQAQLASDIAAHNPQHAQEIALTQAENGMAVVDPMIAQAAAERAHMAFARVMF